MKIIFLKKRVIEIIGDNNIFIFNDKTNKTINIFLSLSFSLFTFSLAFLFAGDAPE